jgi:hypothetical protein
MATIDVVYGQRFCIVNSERFSAALSDLEARDVDAMAESIGRMCGCEVFYEAVFDAGKPTAIAYFTDGNDPIALVMDGSVVISNRRFAVYEGLAEWFRLREIRLGAA